MSSQGYYFRDSCRLCNGKSLQRVIKLSPTPPGNDFVEAAQCDVPQAFYPLEVYFCGDCAHVQLGHVVDPEILYRRNYSYVSATSAVFVEHLCQYAAPHAEGVRPSSRQPHRRHRIQRRDCAQLFQGGGISRCRRGSGPPRLRKLRGIVVSRPCANFSILNKPAGGAMSTARRN